MELLGFPEETLGLRTARSQRRAVGCVGQGNSTRGGNIMRTPQRIVAGIASVALVVGGGAGLAQAAQKKTTNAAAASAARGGHGHGAPGAQAIATYLGLTAAELRTQ